MLTLYPNTACRPELGIWPKGLRDLRSIGGLRSGMGWAVRGIGLHLGACHYHPPRTLLPLSPRGNHHQATLHCHRPLNRRPSVSKSANV